MAGKGILGSAVAMSGVLALLLAGRASPTSASSPHEDEALGGKQAIQQNATTNALELLSPSSERLDVQVASDGTFNIGAFPGTLNSWDLMYRWPELPGTSYTTLRIDGADYVYGQTGAVLEPPTDIGSLRNRSRWLVAQIDVTQTLEIIANNQTGELDVVRITYEVHNVGLSERAVGLRVLIDTEVNYNDGAIFRVPGVGVITNETEFLGNAIPDTFQSFFDIADPEHVAASTLRSTGSVEPDRLVMANWFHLFETTYDYIVDLSFDFSDPFVAPPDSAYALYWDPVPLASGESRTYTTLYGLAELDVDLQAPLALGLTAPASLSVFGGAYSPNPFDVAATILNNGTAPAVGVELAIALPVGLALAEGTPTQFIGTLAVGEERQVSWRVAAVNQSSETTLTFSVTASAANASSKQLNRQITLPALPTRYVALGDSYAAGQGVPPFQAHTDESPESSPFSADDWNLCHRSLDAYPEVLARNNGGVPAPDFWACSGAVVDDLYERATIADQCGLFFCPEGPPWNDPRLDLVGDNRANSLDRLGPDVSLVTISIGGNDVGFASVLINCIFGFDFFPFRDCEEQHDVEVTRKTLDLQVSLGNLLGAIRSKDGNRAYNARVLVVGYPRFFPDPATRDCDWVGGSGLEGGHFTKKEQDWVNEKVDHLNGILKKQTAAAGVEYVHVQEAFDGSELCAGLRDSVSTYMNDANFINREYSFHPNRAGQARLADLVADHLDSPPSGTPIRVTPGRTFASAVSVGSRVGQVTYSSSWLGSDVEMSLIAPSGRIVNRSTVATDVFHQLGPTFEVYTITDPEPGEWTVDLFGVDVPAQGEEVTLNVERLPPFDVCGELGLATSVFVDTGSSVFAGDTCWLLVEEITRGCNPPLSDRFCVSSPVTRGQMAAFLVRALGLTDRLADAFVDDDDSIFQADIERLAAAGITKGCNPPLNDRFCPEGRVTRGQMAAFLVRALGYIDSGGGNLFADDDGSIFEADIDRLGTAGVTRGCNPPVNDRFCPDNVVTRGQMAAFLHRALG